MEEIVLWLSLLLTGGGLVGLALYSLVRRQTAKLRSEIVVLEQRLRQEMSKNQAPAPVKAVVPASSENFSATRTQILKMHRLGQTAAQIAQSVEMPAAEVDLLLKAHSIALRAFEQPTASSRVPVPEEKSVDFWLNPAISA